MLAMANSCISLLRAQSGNLDFKRFREINGLDYQQAKKQFIYQYVEKLLRDAHNRKVHA